MKKSMLRRAESLLFAAIIILLTFLFFTNDFGLVDIRKTSVIIGMGIDMEEQGVKITAQLAVPQPAENGENTKFTEVNAKGETVAAALKEINAKTGFFPKLVFCKLILLGESCLEKNIFSVLDYFYRNDYTQLTPVVATCKGGAGELLSSELPFGNTATVSIERLLSDEAKRSGNVSTVDLKDIGVQRYSPGGACFMPYVECRCSKSGKISEDGGSSESGGGQADSGSGSQSSGKGGMPPKEFVCNKTAYFKDGYFGGVLSEEEAFALNLVKYDVRHAFVSCESEGDNYVLGLRNCSKKIGVRVKDGIPVLYLSFRATAQIQDSDKNATPEEEAKESAVPEKVLCSAESVIKGYFNGLVEKTRADGCDILGAQDLFYRYRFSDYERYKEGFLNNLKIEYDVDLKCGS